MVERGEIKVSKKIKKQIAREKEFFKKYTFNNEFANRPIEFMEKFMIFYNGPKEVIGKNVWLEPWQKWMIASVFGFVDDNGNRICRDMTVIVARKNAKTFIASGIALYMLLADGEGGPQIYSLATKKDQAKEVFNNVSTFIKYSEELRSVLRSTIYEITCPLNDGKLKPLASDSNSLDGLNPSFWVNDEMHAWKDKNLQDVMVSGSGARDEPLCLTITTAGITRGFVYDDMYENISNLLDGLIHDDSQFAFIFELDDEKEVHDKSNWIKANPNMGVSVSESFLEGQYLKAMNKPTDKVGVWTKNFNIPMTSNEIFFTNEMLAYEGFDVHKLQESKGFIGLDMALDTDITVLSYLVPDGNDFLVEQLYMIPEEQVENRKRTDSVDYKQFAELEGENVIFLPGKHTNQEDVLDELLKYIERNQAMVYRMGIDPYRADHILKQVRNAYDKDYAVAVTNGYRKAITPTIMRMQHLFDEGRIKSNSKLLKLNMAGCVADINKENEILLVKKKQTHRIDGVHSLIYAFKAYELYLADNS